MIASLKDRLISVSIYILNSEMVFIKIFYASLHIFIFSIQHIR